MSRITAPLSASAKTYSSVFIGDEIAKRRTAETVPPEILSLLAAHGVRVPTGCKYKVDVIDAHLKSRNTSIDDRLMVKSALRQIDAIE